MATNINKTKQLKPKVKELAMKLANECKKSGYNFAFIETYRSITRQNNLYAQGRTKPGNIVTKARGGYSLHNFKVAFDICPIVDGKLNWNKLSTFDAIGKIGMSVGLEWGGSWTAFIDRPHFQYTAGYSLGDFRREKIDWNKFKADEQIIIPQLDAVQLPQSKSILPIFSRTLSKGMSGPDVKVLQKFLNSDPDTRVASIGAGSRGKETDYFGSLTVKAVKKFQKKYKMMFYSIDMS